ncbi:hypothetical protein MTR67_022900 [Solanum verrucosum]|uniref:Gag-pol polyprotein n=1 Tax=Solanum verrucosum TaxID=315347 RepID=A0AAF0TX58_SOLVR|nr:hypothetical protein MTR67_022900 [Solanum verrucosum]
MVCPGWAWLWFRELAQRELDLQPPTTRRGPIHGEWVLPVVTALGRFLGWSSTRLPTGRGSNHGAWMALGMAPRRAYVRRNVANNVKLEVPQALVNPLVEQVTQAKFRAIFQVLGQAMTAKDNREVVAPVNPNMGRMATRIRNFTRMNLPEFHGSKVYEDPQEFIDDIYKIVGIIGLSTVEIELVAYQLKGVARVWFEQ